MRFVILSKDTKDPFYNPGKYEDTAYVSRRTSMSDDGKVNHRYIYRTGDPSKYWDTIPEGENAFEIGNKKTSATIHINSLPTAGSVKIIGTLRNKDGEVIAQISKEINTGEAFYDQYRKWSPNKGRLIRRVVDELMLYDRPIKTLRDVERSMQDSGLFPEDLQRVQSAAKIQKSVESLREFSELLDYGKVSERTRKQLTSRAREIFRNLSTEDQGKSMQFMIDIMRNEYP